MVHFAAAGHRRRVDRLQQRMLRIEMTQRHQQLIVTLVADFRFAAAPIKLVVMLNQLRQFGFIEFLNIKVDRIVDHGGLLLDCA